MPKPKPAAPGPIETRQFARSAGKTELLIATILDELAKTEHPPPKPAPSNIEPPRRESSTP